MMGRHMRMLATAVACAALLVTGGCTGAGSDADLEGSVAVDGSGVMTSDREANELVVCISGMVTPGEGLPYYEGLSEYVAQKAGLKLRLIHKAEYAELNELLRSGEVDMAFSCSGPYVTGHREFGLELLAAPVVKGASTYQAYVIVPAASDATSIDSLAGKTFAFTDPGSNTGCLVPTYMLAIKGTTPEEFFDRVVYTYSHDNSIKSVAEGQADGASVDSLIWEYANDTNPTYTAHTRVIARSEDFAIPPVVVRPGMDPALKAALQDAFLNAHQDPVGLELLTKMHMEKFVAIEDSAYDSVRDISKWIDAQEAN